MSKPIIEKLKKLAAKDDQGGYILRNFEANEAAERHLLAFLKELGHSDVAVAYRELKKEMGFEYGNG